MNDFTKEELEFLLDDCKNAIDEYQEPDIRYHIVDKLKSLIDNYCEHENVQKT